MKPGPATSTWSMMSPCGRCRTMASATFRGAVWASLAERSATVEVHSPWLVSAGRSMPQSGTSNSASSPASCAALSAARTSSSIFSGMHPPRASQPRAAFHHWQLNPQLAAYIHTLAYSSTSCAERVRCGTPGMPGARCGRWVYERESAAQMCAECVAYHQKST